MVRGLQLLQFRLEVLVGHDQCLDGAAHIAVAHRDRLVAGPLVAADVGQASRFGSGRLGFGRFAHGKIPGRLEGRSKCSYFVLIESSRSGEPRCLFSPRQSETPGWIYRSRLSALEAL